MKNPGELVGMLSVVYPIEIDYFLYFVRCKNVYKYCDLHIHHSKGNLLY